MTNAPLENPDRRHAVLVGCNDYDAGELPDLRCSLNDVNAMKSILADPRYGGFNDVDALPPSASSADVLEYTERFVAGLRQTDMLVFYFSGHGLQDPYDNLYLAVKPTQTHGLGSTSLPVAHLLTLIQNSRPQAAVIVLDCCFSGAVAEAFGTIKSSKNLYIMTSSTSGQTSREKEGGSNSYFTSFLVEGIRDGGADRDSDGRISVDDAYHYAYQLMSAAPTPQEPLRFIPAGARGELLLSRNPTARRLNAGLVPTEQVRKYYAVTSMIELVDREAYQFAILFMGGSYYIEGEPYRVTGFNVSPTHTPNLMQTQTGFECDAFFDPKIISTHGRQGKQVINGHIKVRVRIELEDIYGIFGSRKDGSEPVQLV